MEKKSQKSSVREEVLREFPPVGKYRVRLLQNSKKPDSEPSLDIREYVNADSFEGFTRRGIRLTDRSQMDLLRDVLTEALGAGGTTAKPSPGALPLQ